MYVDHVIGSSSLEFKRSFIKGMTPYAWVVNFGGILFYLALGMLVFVTPFWAVQRTEALTALSFAILYLISPISALMTAVPELRQASIAMRKIEQLEQSLSDGENRTIASDPFNTDSRMHIEFRGVCHHYEGSDDGREFILGPIDLAVRQGEILFIIGGNGSGKTTLAMMLLGLYAPEKGEITLNGVRVTDANRELYRQHFSAVFADFHLFEHLPGNAGEDIHKRADHYVRRLGMGNKVRIGDGKFSTIDLSSGQRKRLALVSSYLEDREFCVFDEWASDQDPVFKRVFYTELLPELKALGKAVIVITHDDGYFDCADRILKLEDGGVRSIQGRAAA